MKGLLAVTAAVASPLAGAAPAVAPTSRLVVARDATGARVAALRLPADGAFALAYRHSYERAPARERYVARREGFSLVAIASPDPGVLDYYELAGRRSKRGATWTLRLARPVNFTAMPLAATAVGRRTLEAGGARAPLYPRRGAAHVRIAVEGG